VFVEAACGINTQFEWAAYQSSRRDLFKEAFFLKFLEQPRVSEVLGFLALYRNDPLRCRVGR
jgi:hypothetical protein